MGWPRYRLRTFRAFGVTMIRPLKCLTLVPLLLAACSAAPSDVVDSVSEDALRQGTLTGRSVSSVADLPAKAPVAGSQRVHLLDVGTGLSVLVQGHDFTMLYDGGSNDDSRGITSTSQRSGNQSRLLAYLFATVGPSGGPECVPQGDAWPAGSTFPEKTIDHLVLSHAHRDHISMLSDVLHCYSVKNVWEPGGVYEQAAYHAFVGAVLAEPGVTYHTAAAPPKPLPKTWLEFPVPDGFSWVQFAENDQVTLGRTARFKVLHVDPLAPASSINDSSVVLKVSLRARTMLLMGDAEAGNREDPDASVGSVEKDLLAAHAPELDADIFQVGHHGSSTSSRKAFIDAVFPEQTASVTRPRFALISAGPTPYSGQVLPDKSIVDEITGLRPGLQLFATDAHDQASGASNSGQCPVKDRIGMDDDAPGGCDNFVIDVTP